MKILQFIKSEYQKLRSNPEEWYELAGVRTQYLFDVLLSNRRLVKTLENGSKIIRFRISPDDSFVVVFEKINDDGNVSMKRHVFPATERIYIQDSLGRIVSMQTAEAYWRSVSHEGNIQIMTKAKTLEPWWQTPKEELPEEKELAALPVLVEDEAIPFTPVKTHIFAKKIKPDYAAFEAPSAEGIVQPQKKRYLRFLNLRKIPILCKREWIEIKKGIKNSFLNMKFQFSIFMKRRRRKKMKGNFYDNIKISE